MSHNNHKHMLLLLTTLTLVLSASAFRFFPFIIYHLCMLNGFSSDALSLHCYHHSEPPNNGDPLLIPVHGSYNWSFHPVVDKVKTYYCDAQWGVKGGRGGFVQFEAFADEESFVDGYCGGRHCVWNYNESGCFIFNLQSQQYHYMYEWQPIP